MLALINKQTVPKFWAKTNLIGPLLPKKWNYGGSSEGSVLMYIVPPLGPTYIGESAKAYGLKLRCLYGEHVGEHFGNP